MVVPRRRTTAFAFVCRDYVLIRVMPLSCTLAACVVGEGRRWWAALQLASLVLAIYVKYGLRIAQISIACFHSIHRDQLLATAKACLITL